MVDLVTFSALWSDMEDALKAFKDEAKALREAATVPDVDTDVAELHRVLVDTRRAQDRLEAMVADLGSIRTRVRTVVAQTKAEFDDAWRNAMLASRVGEYSSAKEKDASHTARAVDELIRVRRAERMLADVEEVYEYVQLKHRGIDTARRDIDTRIRLINLATNLER